MLICAHGFRNVLAVKSVKTVFLVQKSRATDFFIEEAPKALTLKNDVVHLISVTAAGSHRQNLFNKLFVNKGTEHVEYVS